MTFVEQTMHETTCANLYALTMHIAFSIYIWTITEIVRWHWNHINLIRSHQAHIRVELQTWCTRPMNFRRCLAIGLLHTCVLTTRVRNVYGISKPNRPNASISERRRSHHDNESVWRVLRVCEDTDAENANRRHVWCDQKITNLHIRGRQICSSKDGICTRNI